MAINGSYNGVDRCNQGCDSSTTTPALVYFPAGTYKISASLVMFYYTQLIGDATNLPTLLGASNFAGIAMLDSDPYAYGGANWFTNQVR
jgi:glucan 1,3-beta-glucosidase